MLHQKLNEEEARERAIEMISLVGIPNQKGLLTNILTNYPWNEAEDNDSHGISLSAEAINS